MEITNALEIHIMANYKNSIITEYSGHTLKKDYIIYASHFPKSMNLILKIELWCDPVLGAKETFRVGGAPKHTNITLLRCVEDFTSRVVDGRNYEKDK